MVDSAGGFFGGLASGFQGQEALTQNADFNNKRLQIEQQRMQMEEQRNQLARMDQVRKDSTDAIMQTIQQLKIKNQSTDDIAKTMQPVIDRLVDFSQRTGIDGTQIRAQFSAALAAPAVTETEQLMATAKKGKEVKVVKNQDTGVDEIYITDPLKGTTVRARDVVDSAAAAWGQDPAQLYAQLHWESGFNPSARNPKSGATGIAQFDDKTARQYGVNASDPEQSAMGAAHYMSDLEKKPGYNYGLALAAYDWGPRKVDEWLARGGKIGEVPPETIRYVEGISGTPIDHWVAQARQARGGAGAAPGQSPTGKTGATAPAPQSDEFGPLTAAAPGTQPAQPQPAAAPAAPGTAAPVPTAATATTSAISTPMSTQQKNIMMHAGYHDPNTADFLATQYAFGNTDVVKGLRSFHGKNPATVITDRAAQFWIDRGLTPQDANAATAEFAAMRRGAITLGQLEAKRVTAVQTAKNTADIILPLSNKIDRTEYPDINSIILAAKKKTGNQDVIRLGIALETFASNYGTSLGMGNTVLTDFQTKRAQDLLEAAYSKGQLAAGVDQSLIELDREEKGVMQAMHVFMSGMGEDISGNANRRGGGSNSGTTRGIQWSVEP